MGESCYWVACIRYQSLYEKLALQVVLFLGKLVFHWRLGRSLVFARPWYKPCEKECTCEAIGRRSNDALPESGSLKPELLETLMLTKECQTVEVRRTTDAWSSQELLREIDAWEEAWTRPLMCLLLKSE